jgi:RimJ/RimL family protein N-acetyltransferase
MSREGAPDFSRIIGTTHFNMATGEVGLLIGEKGLWGAGLSKAALSLTLRKVFRSTYKLLTPPGVWAVIHPENVASAHLFESLGFVHNGEGRNGQCLYRWAPPEVPA